MNAKRAQMELEEWCRVVSSSSGNARQSMYNWSVPGRCSPSSCFHSVRSQTLIDLQTCNSLHSGGWENRVNRPIQTAFGVAEHVQREKEVHFISQHPCLDDLQRQWLCLDA